MMFKNKDDIREFLDVIDECQSVVWLVSGNGEKYNLKEDNDLVRGMARLQEDQDDQLGLFASCREDESRLMNFYLKKCA